MQPCSAVPFQAPVVLLERTPAIYELLLRDLKAESLEWKPSADRWSIQEVLDHLVRIERLYEQRMRVVVAEENPRLVVFETASEARKPTKSALEHLDEFVALRRAFVFFLHSIPSTCGGRMGIHPELGPVTLSEMLHELANHDLGHLRQIAELYRAQAFYPHAGPFQKYSIPKP